MIDDSEIKKHSVVIGGHHTSITLENIFWRALLKIAYDKNKSASQLLNHIDNNRQGNLSSAVRIYVIRHIMKENHQLKEYKD